MTKIRALIVDDEPLARTRLRMLLEAEDDVAIAGECATGEQAVAAIEKLEPDLLFLDIEMPGMDGFEVLEAVGADRMPVTIFVTAFDHYALRAFDVHAADYLLKPFDVPRFQTALGRARETLRRGDDGELRAQLTEVLKKLEKGPAPLDRIAIKGDGRVFFVRTEDVDWIESADNYVRIHVGTQAHMLRATMTELEAELDPEKFLRIHRTTIVNAERIQEMRPWFHGEYQVKLRDGTLLTLSRSYREKLNKLLGKSM